MMEWLRGLFSMTESQWLRCTAPTKMVRFLRGKTSERKLRLFAVACCRRVWHLLTDERSRKAVEVAERLADGQAAWEEQVAAASYAEQAVYDVTDGPVQWTAERAAAAAAEWTLATDVELAAEWAAKWTRTGELPVLDEQEQADKLRDLFGNPFRPAVVSSTWQTPLILALARTLYEERSFDGLPILADALEEAGCTEADILAHCRTPGEHWRGCWVVDLLLGKS